MSMNNCQDPVTLLPIDASCHRSAGGIKRILLANKSDIATVTVDPLTGEISAITLKVGKAFVEWKFRNNTGSVTSTFASDQATGNETVTSVLSLQFSRAESAKRLAIQTAINSNAVVIVEDAYGQFLYLGYDRDVYVSGGSMVTGTSSSDLNGFTLEFTDESIEFPHFISSLVDVESLKVASAE